MLDPVIVFIKGVEVRTRRLNSLTGSSSHMKDRGFTWFANTLEDDYVYVLLKCVKEPVKLVVINQTNEEYSLWYK